MTSPFVAVPPTTTDPALLVEADGWFPDVDLVLLKAAARIDPSITPERLREATVNAMTEIRRELAAWRVEKEAAGATDMAAVPADEVGGESLLLGLYRRAVHCLVGADLGDRLADIGTTKAGHERADDLVDAADKLRRAARWAINDIRGVARMTVELI